MTTQKQDPQEPRMDKVEEARWRIKHGFYDMPEVIEEAVDKLIEKIEVDEKP